jgi:hypothetical protein
MEELFEAAFCEIDASQRGWKPLNSEAEEPFL